MQSQRHDDVRTRSPPATAPANIRDRDYSPLRCRDVQERHSRFERGSGLVERSDRYFDRDRDRDRDRDGQLQKLSQFNEGLPRGESISMKFQWKHLLAEPLKLNNNATPNSKNLTDYVVARISTENESFQGSRFSGLGGHETAVTKPMSLEIDRARKFSPRPPLDFGLAKHSGRVDGRYLSQLENSNVGHYDNEELLIRDTLRRDKVSARELYGEEEKPVFYSKDASHYKMPMSQSETFATLPSAIMKNNFPGSYSDSLYINSDRVGRTHEVLTEPIGYDGYNQIMHFESFTKHESQVSDVSNYRHTQLSPTKCKPRDYTYPEVRRCEWGDLGTLSDEFGGKMASVRGGYGHRDTARASIVDSILGKIDCIESSHGDRLQASRLLEHLRSLQEQPPISNNHDVSGASYLLKQDGEVLGSRSTPLDFTTEVYPDHESLRGTELCGDHENQHLKEDYGFKRDAEHLKEDYSFERDAGPWSCEEKMNRLPMSECDPGLYKIDDSPHGRLTTEELGLYDLSENMHKRKRGMDRKLNRHSHYIHDLSDGNGQLTGQEMDSEFLSNKPGHSMPGHSQNRKAVRAFDEKSSYRISNPDDLLSSHKPPASIQRHLSKPRMSAGKDKQKWLRPGPPNVSNPSLGNRKPYKSPKRRVDHFHGSCHASGGDPSEAKVIPVKTDPPEDSEEFKLLVCSAFFKFIRQLNENPAQRRRYTEEGKAASLKCSICGSDSKEFADIQSLAMHTIKSLKIGFRAQHLGFHRALCVLRGWNSAVAPNSSWVRLPDAQAVALKEDLVIWPPVVIIQNSSIGNNEPDERMIVTIEVLETMLREMGFGGGKTKVCRGKAANQSIMVVKFNGTLSGLQEAEKLHKFYAENKHGRAEFQEISSDSGNGRSKESRNAIVDKAEDVLYGYLGIAGDLDKLDFETKKRSVVKSKKKIQAIADAPLKTE
ncbi:hypothetical protein L1049_014189 [Liquidambar formosana]|uniref:XS domain-containing protein n=1 Tax=Liquidambar formosana TaxID=63359 RepID=A0AAP0RLN5_LIQFO